MRRLLILLLIPIFGILSCQEEDMPVAPPTSQQTVFVYMPWSTNLTSYFEINILDFESVIKQNILKNERVLVFFATSSTQASLFELQYDRGNCVRKELKRYSTSTFTTSDGITSILNDVKTYAPAERYGMIISCHGKGWLPVSTGKAKTYTRAQKDYWEYEGVPLTRYFGGLSSEYQTDITTLANGISGAGIKMEYILFDDCYMSSIEVAYDLKEVTDYLIASPTEMMAYGMPYADIGRYLLGKVDYEAICKGFLSFYQNYSMPCGTIAVTNCSEVENLATVMKEINGRFSFDTSLLGTVQRLDGYTPVIFFDLADYVAKLCTDDELLSQFEMQLERTIPSASRMHTRTYYSMSRGQVLINAFSGVTISDPSVNTDALAKSETAWYKATHE